MYTENNNGGLLRNIILKLLFIALFIFLLLWLYPSKNTKPFYDAIFNNNIMMMKEVAEDYYTVQRLPKEVGEKHKLTLKEMLDMKLLLPFTDKNGEYCDTEKSYVQVTKLENDEYELKVTLSCKGQTDYIIVYLGCHDLCVDGKCETVVSVLEYKFERELFKGRKLVTTDLYKYEYSKTTKEEYIVEKPVVYYKGKIKVSEDTYEYEYSKSERVPYEIINKVDYYKGQKKISDAIYENEYKKTTTLYKGRITNNVYTYEYAMPVTITKPSAPSCTTKYNQSSCPSGASCSSSTKTITVNDGYEYGPWTTSSSFQSTTPRPTTATDTSRTVSNGYTIQTGVCNKSSCPQSQIVYKYIVQTRTKKPKTIQKQVTTYNYTICTPNAPTQTTTTETTWSTKHPGGSWVATGKSKLVSSNSIETDWVTSLPAGYTKIDEKVSVEYKYSTEDLTKKGWTKTNNKKLVQDAKYDYIDWVKKLPAGYTQTAKTTREEKTIGYRTEIKTQYSIEDLTKKGWTKTGNKKLVKAGEYKYTDWVKELPAGYTQTDKKEVNEKFTETKDKTEKIWSTSDLTKEGWTKTGKKEKVGETTEYKYTDWVTKLPAGYTQTDKKIEATWSTEKELSGWKLTDESRVKEDK